MARKKSNKESFQKKVEAIPSPSPSGPEDEARVRRTNEEIFQDREKEIRKILSDKPDPMFPPLIKMLFNVWPASVIATIRYEDLAKMAERTMFMTDQEAAAVALPVTQLKNFYLPNINPIWLAWANLASAVYSVVSIRLNVLRELRGAINQREQEKEPEVCKCAGADKIPADDKGLCSVCHKPRPKK